MKRWGLIGTAGLFLTLGAHQRASADQPSGQYLGIVNNGFYGWACVQGQQAPTSVELYLDSSPDQGGRPVAQSLANLSSGSHCGSSSVGWNFNIPLLNDLVDGSHSLVFVALGSNGARITLQPIGPAFYDFKGAIRGAVTGITRPTLSGWACEVDNSANNQVGLYLDVGPDQGGQPVATTIANLPLGTANCSTGPGDPHSNHNTNIAYRWDLSSLTPIAGVHQLFVAAVSSKGHRIPVLGSFPYDFSASTRSSHANRIDVSGGVATLVVNNVATPGLGVGPICGRNRSAGELHDWTAAGFTLTRMIFPLGDDVYQNCGPVWHWSWDGGSTYYWNDLDYEVNRRVLNDPSVRIILEVALDGAGGQIPDYLSDSWVAGSKAALQAMVTHLNATFPGRVVGYELFNGKTYDCNFPVDVSSPAATTRFRAFLTAKYQTDQALQKAWNQGGVTLATAQLLIVPACQTWPVCEYEYTLPADQDRTAMDQLMPLFSSASMQQYTDSREFAFREKEQVIYNFADDIKQASQGQALVGARSGEFPEMPWIPQQVFQFYTMDFYTYPNIDFYEIWESYRLPREFGPLGGSGVPYSPRQGLAALNKLFMVQNDFRIAYGGTSQWPSYNPTYPPGWWDTVPEYGYEPTTAESVQKLRRVFTNSVVNGTPFYLFQMTDYYDQPYLLLPGPLPPSEWKVQLDIASRALKVDRSSVAEVAYVVDPSFQKSYADHWDDYIDGGGTEGEQPVYEPGPGDYTEVQPMARWARAGVPFDMIFLDQIENTSYKVYVFYHTISLSADQIQRIQRVLSANHAVGIFVDADGMLDGNGSAGPPTLGKPFNSNPDVGAYISNLTGMHITGVMEPHTSKLAPTNFFLANGGVQKYPDSWVNHTGYFWDPCCCVPPPCNQNEVDFQLFPSFYVTPTPGVNSLATFNETPPGRVAVAERPMPPGTNIKDILYSTTSMVPPDLMRYAALKAGAQQYSDTEDHIFVDKSFVGFHTEAAGTITLTLPQASALHDVFIANTWPGNICQPQTDYPSNTTQRIAVRANCTYLFYRGTSADWAALRGH